MEPELGKDGGPVNGDPPPQARPAALVFIFITLMLDMLALGMIVPVLPKLVEDFVHGDTARASYVVGVFGTVRALMQFVSGTRRAFRQLWATSGGVLSNFGLGLDYDVRMPDLLRAVTLDDVNDAAKHLEPERATVVIAGPYQES